MRIPSISASLGAIFLATILAVPMGSQSQNAHSARPGSINYVEGQASIGTSALTAESIGSVELEKDQLLTTTAGKAEILLTPGVFLRAADNSAVKMISPGLADTEVELVKGRALVEVLEIRKENNIRIDQNDANTKLLKKGLYDFDAEHNQVRVFAGQAEVNMRSQRVKVTGDHDLTLSAGAKLKPQSFDTRQYEDEFYRWSGLRSGFLSEASVDTARTYVGVGVGWYGPGWYGAGWYWNPWFDVYTFIPLEGIFYSPFGWGFYSPIAVYWSPFFYYGYYHHPHRFSEFHEPYGHGFEPHGGFRGRGPGGGGAPHGGGGAPGGGGGAPHGGGRR